MGKKTYFIPTLEMPLTNKMPLKQDCIHMSSLVISTNAPKLIQNKTFPHLNPSISNKKKTLQRRGKKT